MSLGKKTSNTNSQFQLDNWPFYWLAQAGNQYHAVLERALKPSGLDIPRWRVLMQLDHSTSLPVSILAREAICKLSTMTRIIQRMEADGLIVTCPSPADARVTQVSLTDSGEAARAAAWRIADSLFGAAFAGMKPKDAAQLNVLLSQLFSNLLRL